MSSDIGLVGLAVMGENLVLNMESRGFNVAVYNRTTQKVTDFVEGRAKGKNIVGCESIEDLTKQLKAPRRVMIMVRAGKPVDYVIADLVKVLDKGDIIIDGGNSNYNDTIRRCKEMAEKGIHFMGAGVSGGEEGALKGPSIMPGGDEAAWPHVKPIFQAICAKVDDDQPCCEWVGSSGAGHYVKMVHNGIEYGDMQLLSEAYLILKNVLGYSNQQVADLMDTWNKGDLDSYLVEITAQIFAHKDGDDYVIDQILDAAGQKGTGKWTAISGLDMGIPATLIGEAVFARCLSAQKDERVAAEKELPSGVSSKLSDVDAAQLIKDLEKAVYAAKLVSYAQGFQLIRAAASEYDWKLHYGSIALMWRGGCIIRSKFLGNIKQAFDTNADLPCLVLDPFFKGKIAESLEGWRRIAAISITRGVPVPAITTALSWYDGYRTGRGGANLIQAQRDFFGAHTYERVDKPRGEHFHTNWTGRGGTTSASTYSI